MNLIKKLLGVCWLLLGLCIIVYLPFHAVVKISGGKMEEIVFWTILVFIFLPIAFGFSLFGWYALKGEYEEA